MQTDRPRFTLRIVSGLVAMLAVWKLCDLFGLESLTAMLISVTIGGVAGGVGRIMPTGWRAGWKACVEGLICYCRGTNYAPFARMQRGAVACYFHKYDG